MDFNTKKFWVAQVLSALVIVACIAGKVDFDAAMTAIMSIEVSWGVLDVAADFAKKKTGGQ